MRPALILAAVLAVTAGLLALIDTHRDRPKWDDYRDAPKERPVTANPYARQWAPATGDSTSPAATAPGKPWPPRSWTGRR